MSERHVKGLSELNKFLQELPVKIEKNVLRGSLRAGAKIIHAQAVANVPVKSGDLRNSIKISTRSRGGTVTASVRTKLFYAKFVEFGTRPHTITANDGLLFFGGIFARSVQHPGARPKPFMRVALDGQASAAVIAAAEYMKRRLQTKHGLDTSDIIVEGDE